MAHRAGAPENPSLDDGRAVPDGVVRGDLALARRVATIHELRRVEGLRGVVALPLHDERLDDASEAEALETERLRVLAQQSIRLRRGPDCLSGFGIHERRVVVVDALSRGLGRRRRAADRRRRGLDGDEASRVEDVHVRVGGLDGPGGRVDPDMIVRGPQGFDGDELDAVGRALAGDAAHDGVRRVAAARPAGAHQTPLVAVGAETQAQVEVRAGRRPHERDDDLFGRQLAGQGQQRRARVCERRHCRTLAHAPARR